jgi:hypothetical protein
MATPSYTPTPTVELPATHLNVHRLDTIPAYIQQDYPIFTAFIQAYDTWVDQQIQDSMVLPEALELDRTSDDFLNHWTQMFLRAFPTPTAMDRARVITFAKAFYESRGTPLGYSLFWRMVFGSDVTIRGDGQDVFTTSSGDWSKRVYLKSMSPNLDLLRGRMIVNLTRGDSGAIVEDITVLRGTVTEIALRAGSLVGSFQIGDVVSTDDAEPNLSFVVTGVILGVSITNRGHNYEPGLHATVTTGAGGGEGAGGLVEVQSVTTDGIDSLTIRNGGQGYLLYDVLTFTPNQAMVSDIHAAVGIVTRISPGIILGVNDDRTRMEDGSGFLEHEKIDYTPATIVYFDPYSSVDVGNASYGGANSSDPLFGISLNNDLAPSMTTSNTIPFLVPPSVGPRTAYGDIREVAIQVPGTGYMIPPLCNIVTAAANTWAITAITSELYSFQTANITSTTPGGQLESLVIVDSGHQYTIPPEIDLSGLGDHTGAALATIGTVTEDTGTYGQDDAGQPSGRQKLADGDLYQHWSYAIRSDQPASVFERAAQSMLHPAGSRFRAVVLEHDAQAGWTSEMDGTLYIGSDDVTKHLVTIPSWGLP